MINLLSLLAQPKSEAVIEILIILIVSASIGYITSWQYYKSIYKKRIKALVSKLENHIRSFNEERNNLQRSLNEKDFELEHRIMEANALRALHAEAVHETDDMTIKNKRNEQLLYEKDEALSLITIRRHLLDYKSFGSATKEEQDNLKMISGIGPFIEERLHALDIYTFRQISNFSKNDIETINDAIEYFSGRIERDEWVVQAKELVRYQDKRADQLNRIRLRKAYVQYNRIGIAEKEEADDLTIISGIGGWIKEKLNALDIYTFRQISNFNEEDIQIVTDVIEYFPGRIERDEWILQAKELKRIAGKKEELLKRIRERKGKIYYDRLGIAYKHNANNLTLIKGIGLWIEERLNLLDIYTFDQISKLTPADIKTITGILEISPGRINRDKWVSQANELAKMKYDKVLI
jgi:predicted flap endonuclease-1-like 5' DNA nuclease